MRRAGGKPSIIINKWRPRGAFVLVLPEPTSFATMPIIDTDLHTRVSTAWCQQLEHTSAEARHLAQRLAHEHAVALVGHFYASMLEDADASEFLSHQMVEQRLAASLHRWLEEVLRGGDAATIETLIARQVEIGNVHARIGIPAHLVAAGARLIKQTLNGHIEQADADTATRFQAVHYATCVIDLTVEAMIAAYSQAREQSVKEEEAYRYFVGVKNIGLERERQQSSLLEWENSVVFQLATGAPLANLPLLSVSTFGLWFKHKGHPVFNKDPQSDTVVALITACDTAVEALQRSRGGDSPEARTGLLRQLHSNATQIKQLTQSMFEKMTELESGRDELTHLLNRRFLSTVLRREVALSGRGRKSFSITMVDVDHFKAINDLHGHAAGDLALQSVAAVLLRNLRVSDYAFRYGGEEFLLLLVETDVEKARMIGERIRREIANENVRLPGGESLKLTVSVGVAPHTGHPDYARTLAAADAALYRAKALGRNRVEVSPAGA